MSALTSRLVKLMSSLLNRGVRDDLSSEMRKKVILTNQVILITVGLSLLYAVLYFSFGAYPFGIVTLALAVLFCLVYNIIERGHYDFARFTILVSSIVSIFFYGSSLGRNGGAQLLLFPLLSFAFILFGLGEYLKLIVIALCAATCFILLNVTDYSLFTVAQFTEHQTQLNFQVTFVVSILLTVMCIYILARVNEIIERQLLREQEQLKTKDIHTREVNARLTAILESTQDLIFAIDNNFRYISFNKPHMQRMRNAFGVKIRLNMSLLDVPEIARNRDYLLASFERALKGEQFSLEQKVDYATLPPAYFETTYNPIRNDKREITGVAVFSKDITAKKQAEEQIINAKQEAERAVKVKTEFLSNMSHELRTPMNAVIGLTELLLSQEDDVKKKDNLRVIKKSGENLLFLLNDVLDINKLEAGHIRFEMKDFDLPAAVNDVLKIFRLSADEKLLKLSYHISDQVPQIVCGDRNRLDQILLNLISNAVKFTDHGGVTVSVDRVSEDNESDRLRFTVADTGIGIPEDKLEYIFENFTQAFSDTTRKYGGTGLGLAITKNLLQLQGGEIRVESRLGFGTKMIFELPYGKAKATKQVLPSVTPSEIYDLSNINVLVVDDNRVNQLLLVQILKKWRAKIETASDGVEALDKIQANDFDIILLDLHMPEMNGFEVTERIRRNFSAPKNKVPVVAVTADVFDHAREKVKEAGMNDFVVKPFGPNELYEIITRNLASVEQASGTIKELVED